MKNSYTCTWPNWHSIPWKHCFDKVKLMQEQIAVAYNKGDMQEVTRLQEELTTSPEACAVAVRKVRTNPGGKTPGTDNVVWNTPRDRFKAFGDLL